MNRTNLSRVGGGKRRKGIEPQPAQSRKKLSQNYVFIQHLLASQFWSLYFGFKQKAALLVTAS